MEEAAAVLGGAAASAVAAPINYYFESKAAEQNQQYYKENLAANFQLSQLAQRNAAGNEVSGLRAAGLSPALANGAAATPVPSAPQGTMKAPNVDPANLLLFAELKNLKAQTDKTESETQAQKIKNEREIHQDNSISQNIAATYRDLASRTNDNELKSWFEESASYAAEGKANLGDYEAMLKTLDLVGKPEEFVQRKLDRKITAWLTELKYSKVVGSTAETSSFVKALVSLDARQSDLLAAEAANLIASKKNQEQQLEYLKSKTNLTNEQINLTKEQEQQIRTAAETMQDHNIMHWIDKGEYAKAFMVGLLQIFSGFAAKGRSYARTD